MQNKNFLATIFVSTILIFSVFFYGIGRVSNSYSNPITVSASEDEDADTLRIRAELDAEALERKQAQELQQEIDVLKTDLENIAGSIDRLAEAGKNDSISFWLDIYSQKLETLAGLEKKEYLTLEFSQVLPYDFLDRWLSVRDENGKKAYEVFFASDGSIDEDTFIPSSYEDGDEVATPYFIRIRKR